MILLLCYPASVNLQEYTREKSLEKTKRKRGGEMLFSEFDENVQMLSNDLDYGKFEFYRDLESIYMNSNISKREVYILAGLIINLSRNRTTENKEVKRAIKSAFNFKLYLLNEEFEKSN